MIAFEPIGNIHTPFTEREGMPVQPAGGRDLTGTVEIHPPYADGLQDLDGFSHIMLIYHLHAADGYALRVMPFMDNEERGVFATRSPKRPNAIGLSVVRLDRVAGRTLHIRDLDMLDGTPLLDIKPYVPALTPGDDVRTGWFKGAEHRIETTKADTRFY